MNVWIDRKTDRQTDEPHKLHIYVGLAQAHPKLHHFFVFEITIILRMHECLLSSEDRISSRLKGLSSPSAMATYTAVLVTYKTICN